MSYATNAYAADHFATPRDSDMQPDRLAFVFCLHYAHHELTEPRQPWTEKFMVFLTYEGAMKEWKALELLPDEYRNFYVRAATVNR